MAAYGADLLTIDKCIKQSRDCLTMRKAVLSRPTAVLLALCYPRCCSACPFGGMFATPSGNEQINAEDIFMLLVKEVAIEIAWLFHNQQDWAYFRDLSPAVLKRLQSR